MTDEEFEALLIEYGNSCFDCGNWDDDPEPYDQVYGQSEKMKAAVIAAWKAK